MNAPEKPKWGRDKFFLFVAAMVFLFVVLPILIFYMMFHGFLHSW
jgi:hypothetical protein